MGASQESPRVLPSRWKAPWSNPPGKGSGGKSGRPRCAWWKRQTDEFLRSIAHLRPRTNKYGALFRIRSESAFAVHSFFRDRGFYYLHTPIITGSDCEGAGAMFRVTTLPLGIKEYGDTTPLPAKDFFRQEVYHRIRTIGGGALCLCPGR